MKTLLPILLLVLAGCSNDMIGPTREEVAALNARAMIATEPLLDHDGPTTVPPVIPGTCQWVEIEVMTWLHEDGGMPPFFNGKVPGFHQLSNGLWVFLEDRPYTPLGVKISYYPEAWCFAGAS